MKKLLLIAAGIPAAIFYLRQRKKNAYLDQPTMTLKIWGNTSNLSEEDMHNLASTVSMNILGSCTHFEDITALPVGAEQAAVEEAMQILNLK